MSALFFSSFFFVFFFFFINLLYFHYDSSFPMSSGILFHFFLSNFFFFPVNENRRGVCLPLLELALLNGAARAEPSFLTRAAPERGLGLGDRLLESLATERREGEGSKDLCE
jgi:hypothetical protein